MTFHNRTRVSASIPQRLRREGRWYLLPLYWLLTTSDLAREAVAGSGSWQFADHIYRSRSSGRFGIGVVIDSLLLHLTPARAFRTRYEFARDRAAELIAGDPSASILSVPCGIPRDLIEATAGAPGSVTVYGLDLDPEPMGVAAAEVGAVPFQWIEADAFDDSAYPRDVDLVISTGFGEFLDDDLFHEFLGHCRQALAPGGTLVITATARNRFSDYLLQIAEVRAHYRSAADLERHLEKAGFVEVSIETHPSGLQAYATARKEPA